MHGAQSTQRAPSRIKKRSSTSQRVRRSKYNSKRHLHSSKAHHLSQHKHSSGLIRSAEQNRRIESFKHGVSARHRKIHRFLNDHSSILSRYLFREFSTLHPSFAFHTDTTLSKHPLFQQKHKITTSQFKKSPPVALLNLPAHIRALSLSSSSVFRQSQRAFSKYQSRLSPALTLHLIRSNQRQAALYGLDKPSPEDQLPFNMQLAGCTYVKRSIRQAMANRAPNMVKMFYNTPADQKSRHDWIAMLCYLSALGDAKQTFMLLDNYLSQVCSFPPLIEDKLGYLRNQDAETQQQQLSHQQMTRQRRDQSVQQPISQTNYQNRIELPSFGDDNQNDSIDVNHRATHQHIGSGSVPVIAPDGTIKHIIDNNDDTSFNQHNDGMDLSLLRYEAGSDSDDNDNHHSEDHIPQQTNSMIKSTAQINAQTQKNNNTNNVHVGHIDADDAQAQLDDILGLESSWNTQHSKKKEQINEQDDTDLFNALDDSSQSNNSHPKKHHSPHHSEDDKIDESLADLVHQPEPRSILNSYAIQLILQCLCGFKQSSNNRKRHKSSFTSTNDLTQQLLHFENNEAEEGAAASFDFYDTSQDFNDEDEFFNSELHQDSRALQVLRYALKHNMAVTSGCFDVVLRGISMQVARDSYHFRVQHSVDNDASANNDPTATSQTESSLDGRLREAGRALNDNVIFKRHQTILHETNEVLQLMTQYNIDPAPSIWTTVLRAHYYRINTIPRLIDKQTSLYEHVLPIYLQMTQQHTPSLAALHTLSTIAVQCNHIQLFEDIYQHIVALQEMAVSPLHSHASAQYIHAYRLLTHCDLYVKNNHPTIRNVQQLSTQIVQDTLSHCDLSHISAPLAYALVRIARQAPSTLSSYQTILSHSTSQLSPHQNLSTSPEHQQTTPQIDIQQRRQEIKTALFSAQQTTPGHELCVPRFGEQVIENLTPQQLELYSIATQYYSKKRPRKASLASTLFTTGTLFTRELLTPKISLPSEFTTVSLPSHHLSYLGYKSTLLALTRLTTGSSTAETEDTSFSLNFIPSSFQHAPTIAKKVFRADSTEGMAYRAMLSNLHSGISSELSPDNAQKIDANIWLPSSSITLADFVGTLALPSNFRSQIAPTGAHNGTSAQKTAPPKIFGVNTSARHAKPSGTGQNDPFAAYTPGYDYSTTCLPRQTMDYDTANEVVVAHCEALNTITNLFVEFRHSFHNSMQQIHALDQWQQKQATNPNEPIPHLLAHPSQRSPPHIDLEDGFATIDDVFAPFDLSQEEHRTKLVNACLTLLQMKKPNSNSLAQANDLFALLNSDESSFDHVPPEEISHWVGTLIADLISRGDINSQALVTSLVPNFASISQRLRQVESLPAHVTLSEHLKQIPRVEQHQMLSQRSDIEQSLRVIWQYLHAQMLIWVTPMKVSPYHLATAAQEAHSGIVQPKAGGLLGKLFGSKSSTSSSSPSKTFQPLNTEMNTAVPITEDTISHLLSVYLALPHNIRQQSILPAFNSSTNARVDASSLSGLYAGVAGQRSSASNTSFGNEVGANSSIHDSLATQPIFFSSANSGALFAFQLLAFLDRAGHTITAQHLHMFLQCAHSSYDMHIVLNNFSAFQTLLTTTASNNHIHNTVRTMLLQFVQLHSPSLIKQWIYSANHALDDASEQLRQQHIYYNALPSTFTTSPLRRFEASLNSVAGKGVLETATHHLIDSDLVMFRQQQDLSSHHDANATQLDAAPGRFVFPLGHVNLDQVSSIAFERPHNDQDTISTPYGTYQPGTGRLLHEHNYDVKMHLQKHQAKPPSLYKVVIRQDSPHHMLSQLSVHKTTNPLLQYLSQNANTHNNAVSDAVLHRLAIDAIVNNPIVSVHDLELILMSLESLSHINEFSEVVSLAGLFHVNKQRQSFLVPSHLPVKAAIQSQLGFNNGMISAGAHGAGALIHASTTQSSDIDQPLIAPGNDQFSTHPTSHAPLKRRKVQKTKHLLASVPINDQDDFVPVTTWASNNTADYLFADQLTSPHHSLPLAAPSTTAEDLTSPPSIGMAYYGPRKNHLIPNSLSNMPKTFTHINALNMFEAFISFTNPGITAPYFKLALWVLERSQQADPGYISYKRYLNQRKERYEAVYGASMRAAQTSVAAAADEADDPHAEAARLVELEDRKASAEDAEWRLQQEEEGQAVSRDEDSLLAMYGDMTHELAQDAANGDVTVPSSLRHFQKHKSTQSNSVDNPTQRERLEDIVAYDQSTGIYHNAGIDVDDGRIEQRQQDDDEFLFQGNFDLSQHHAVQNTATRLFTPILPSSEHGDQSADGSSAATKLDFESIITQAIHQEFYALQHQHSHNSHIAALSLPSQFTFSQHRQLLQTLRQRKILSHDLTYDPYNIAIGPHAHTTLMSRVPKNPTVQDSLLPTLQNTAYHFDAQLPTVVPVAVYRQSITTAVHWLVSFGADLRRAYALAATWQLQAGLSIPFSLDPIFDDVNVLNPATASSSSTKQRALEPIRKSLPAQVEQFSNQIVLSPVVQSSPTEHEITHVVTLHNIANNYHAQMEKKLSFMQKSPASYEYTYIFSPLQQQQQQQSTEPNSQNTSSHDDPNSHKSSNEALLATAQLEQIVPQRTFTNSSYLDISSHDEIEQLQNILETYVMNTSAYSHAANNKLGGPRRSMVSPNTAQQMCSSSLINDTYVLSQTLQESVQHGYVTRDNEPFTAKNMSPVMFPKGFLEPGFQDKKDVFAAQLIQLWYNVAAVPSSSDQQSQLHDEMWKIRHDPDSLLFSPERIKHELSQQKQALEEQPSFSGIAPNPLEPTSGEPSINYDNILQSLLYVQKEQNVESDLFVCSHHVDILNKLFLHLIPLLPYSTISNQHQNVPSLESMIQNMR